MRLRKIALTGIAALALSIPAAANAGTGWYLGLGAGWDHLENVKMTNPPFTGNVKSDDSALFAGTIGHKWDSGWRLEEEIGYVSNGVSTLHRIIPPGGTVNGSGSQRAVSILGNLVYDIPVSDTVSFSLGGGAGVGWVRENTRFAGGARFAIGQHAEFEWQGI